MLRYILPLLAMMTVPAGAVDFSRPVINVETDKPFCEVALGKDEDCPSDRVITLGNLAKAALRVNDQSTDGEVKYKREELAQSLTGATEVKLTREQREMIKGMIGKAMPAIYIKPAWDMLEK